VNKNLFFTVWGSRKTKIKAPVFGEGDLNAAASGSEECCSFI
jgi:hypothetical protein